MNEGNTDLAFPVPIPVPGTNAYWAAQREAFALIEAWQTTDPDDPGAELAALRRIAAHSFAAGVMNAHGRTLARWIRELETMEEDRYRTDAVTDDGDEGPETEPKGDDWCPRGCQPLYHLGECGMCGYEGRGVAIDATDTVAEYCCHCGTRTYQDHAGMCQLCGHDAETFGPATPADSPALGHGTEGVPCPPEGRCTTGPGTADDGHCCSCRAPGCPDDAPSATARRPAPMPPLGDGGAARDMQPQQQTP